MPASSATTNEAARRGADLGRGAKSVALRLDDQRLPTVKANFWPADRSARRTPEAARQAGGSTTSRRLTWTERLDLSVTSYAPPVTPRSCEFARKPSPPQRTRPASL